MVLLLITSPVLTFSRSDGMVENAHRLTMEPMTQPYNATRSSWSFHSYPGPDEIITLTTILQLDKERIAALERTLFEVSDPKHAQYGNHKTHAEIAEILSVPRQQVERVVDFWTDNGASAVEVHPTKDTMRVTISIRDAEVALATRLGRFSNPTVSSRIVRAIAPYSLPLTIARDVAMVGELHQFPRPRTIKRAPPETLELTASWPNTCQSRRCSNAVTPSVLATRYRFPLNQTEVSGNSMAVAEFEGQYYFPPDLSAFNQMCGADAQVDQQIGDNMDTPGIEAELDIEYIRAVAPSVPLTDVYDTSYSLLSWAHQITSLSPAPLVHSVSYGNDEAQQISHVYMTSANTAFIKAGVMGLSILFASGDQGVCGREGCGLIRHKYHPDFPAASPYVTAVGGTDFASPGVIGEEKAWVDSGGGFSDTFRIPSYQSSAVASYLSDPDANLPNANYFNSKGRGYPDVAALAGTQNPYCVFNSGGFEGVGGTSAASPVVAAIFARLNGLRLAKGKKPMGFLNPFIYQNPSAFNDVKQGVNYAGKGAGGFKAIAGWDPATGVGTPDYHRLSRLV